MITVYLKNLHYNNERKWFLFDTSLCFDDIQRYFSGFTLVGTYRSVDVYMGEIDQDPPTHTGWAHQFHDFVGLDRNYTNRSRVCRWRFELSGVIYTVFAVPKDK